jgi:hypothetical protein
MPLTLWDVERDPIAARALDRLVERFTVAEEKSGLVLTNKTGQMKIFLRNLDDLHQWDFIQNKDMKKENERLRVLSQILYQQHQSWKDRALAAEATLLETETNKNVKRENEQLRSLSLKLYQQRQSWKHRALLAEATLLETGTSNNGEHQNVSDLRYAALKRYLAKQFHPDFAPGSGIEKVIRIEIFKEIWSEVERLNRQGVSDPRSATKRTSSRV